MFPCREEIPHLITQDDPLGSYHYYLLLIFCSQSKNPDIPLIIFLIAIFFLSQRNSVSLYFWISNVGATKLPQASFQIPVTTPGGRPFIRPQTVRFKVNKIFALKEKWQKIDPETYSYNA